MGMHWMRHKVICTVMLFVLVPEFAHATKPSVPNTNIKTEKPLLTDIALQPGGILVGRVLSLPERPQKQQKIVIRQNNQVVAEVTTGANGQFTANGLRGGIYEITSSQGVGSFRAWADGTAPPSARQFAVLVDNADVVRGQWGWMPYPGSNLSVAQWVGISVGVAGLAVGTIALVDSRDPS